MSYSADKNRYQNMQYRNCGSSGLKLPLLSVGLWHNFGGSNGMSPESKKILFASFDAGITHFDLANNYGPPYGSAEANFGKVMQSDFKKYRDEMIISSKAGYDMWDGPYGEWGSKKHVIASCDQSLKRIKVDYVDIFYSHRFDPNTPLEETADALESIYRSGKALYIGISSYSANKTREIIKILNSRGIKLFIHQPSYSMINRWIEKDLTKTLTKNGVGCIAFSPLAQGFLSNKYLKGIPRGTRVSENSSFSKDLITKNNLKIINNLNSIAKKRNQSLSQLALAWVLNNKAVTSALIGVRTVAQLKDNLAALNNLKFTKDEIKKIDKNAKEGNINLWAPSSSY